VIGLDPLGKALPTLGVLDHAYSTADSHVYKLTMEAEQAHRLYSRLLKVEDRLFWFRARLLDREMDAKAEAAWLNANPTL